MDGILYVPCILIFIMQKRYISTRNFLICSSTFSSVRRSRAEIFQRAQKVNLSTYISHAFLILCKCHILDSTAIATEEELALRRGQDRFGQVLPGYNLKYKMRHKNLSCFSSGCCCQYRVVQHSVEFQFKGLLGTFYMKNLNDFDTKMCRKLLQKIYIKI